MAKTHVKLRVGLLDHMQRFSTNTDALQVYIWCLLQAPISGPDAGTVMINQRAVSEVWEWRRERLNRAVRWLQVNPSLASPMLVQIERGSRDKPGRYAIPKFETFGRPDPKSARSAHTTPNGFGTLSAHNAGSNCAPGAHNGADCVRDSARVAHTMPEMCARFGPPGAHIPTSIDRARQKERESEEREGFRMVEERDGGDWIPVPDEAQARQALLHARGFASIPEDFREKALETALKNLDMYRICYIEEWVDDDEIDSDQAAKSVGQVAAVASGRSPYTD